MANAKSPNNVLSSNNFKNPQISFTNPKTRSQGKGVLKSVDTNEFNPPQITSNG